MASRFKELKAQYDAAKLNMSKRKVHEFLEKLFQLAGNMESANDYADGVISELIDRRKAEIAELNQQLTNLEYSRKVKVPEFVAEWIEEIKNRDSNVWHYLKAISDDDSPLSHWVWAQDNVDMLAKALLNGYEVEEEPKYRVACTDGYLSFVRFSNVVWEIETSSKGEEAIVIHSKEKAEQVARIANGTVVDA